MILVRTFTFDSAHYLTHVPVGHKCASLHGHTYKLTVYVSGDVDPENGWVMDFASLKKTVSDILEKIDHKLLNDIPGLDNPTCENLVLWLWNEIRECVPMLSKLELWETPNSGVIFEG